jgi:hypothetical protein
VYRSALTCHRCIAVYESLSRRVDASGPRRRRPPGLSTPVHSVSSSAQSTGDHLGYLVPVAPAHDAPRLRADGEEVPLPGDIQIRDELVLRTVQETSSCCEPCKRRARAANRARDELVLRVVQEIILCHDPISGSTFSTQPKGDTDRREAETGVDT